MHPHRWHHSFVRSYSVMSTAWVPPNEQLFCLVSVPPPPSPPPSHPSVHPKMFCWLINSGSLQTSSYDGLSGQELVTEPDLTPAFVWAWPLSWLLNERWRDEPLKTPLNLLLPFPALPFVGSKDHGDLLLCLHQHVSLAVTCSRLNLFELFLMRKWNGHTQHVWDDNGWRQSSDADTVRLQMQSNVRNIRILVTCESCIVCKISHCLFESVILKPMVLHNLQRSSLWLEHSLPESVWQQLMVYSARTPIHIVDQYFFKFHFIIHDHSPLLLDTWKLKENPKHRSKTPYLQWNVDSYAFCHSSAELLHLSNIKKK